MNKYQSKHANFGFYVDGVRYRFANGVFVTDDKKLHAVLDNLSEVTCVEKPKPAAAPKPKAETKTKASAK